VELSQSPWRQSDGIGRVYGDVLSYISQFPFPLTLYEPLILSVNWRQIIDLVSAKWKTKEVYCCDIVVLIVLFDVLVAWRITKWNQYIETLSDKCESISINWLLFSPLPKLGQLTSTDRKNGITKGIWPKLLKCIQATKASTTSHL